MDIPASIQVVPKELLADQGAYSLDGVLKNVSGATQNSGSNYGFFNNYQLRGLEQKFLRDGIPDGPSINGYGRTLTDVERVEVLKGPGSALCGIKEQYRKRTRTFGIALALWLALGGDGVGAQTLWDDPAFALYQQAVKAFNAKDHKRAEALARKAIGHYPNHLLAHYLLGRAAIAQEKWEEAIQALSKAVALYPKSFAGRRDLAVCFEQVNRQDDAIAAYKEALKLRPDNEAIQARVALLYLQTEKTDQAFALLKELAQKKTKDPQVWHAFGRLYYNRKAYTESEKALRQAVSLSSDDGAIWFDLGAVRLQLKDYQGAAKAFEQAAKDPKLRPRSYREAGRIYEYYLSDMAKANQYYEKAQNASEKP